MTCSIILACMVFSADYSLCSTNKKYMQLHVHQQLTIRRPSLNLIGCTKERCSHAKLEFIPIPNHPWSIISETKGEVCEKKV